MSPTWDEVTFVFERVRAFSAEVEQRLGENHLAPTAECCTNCNTVLDMRTLPVAQPPASMT